MTHPIEKWYTGKALTILREYVLPTLREAEAQGFWPKGASRKVKAALNKQAVALKFARANEHQSHQRPSDHEGLLDDVCDDRKRWYSAKVSAHGFLHAMRFGLFEHAPKLVPVGPQLDSLCRTSSERDALATARQWADDFTPIAELVALLDSTRPAPVVVLGSLSPTVAGNLGTLLGVDFTTIRSPEIEWTWVDYTIKGAVYRVRMGTIKWPPGCHHNISRFARLSCTGNDQCHACGHAIKDPFNWVPLVAETSGGPVSLWVGRDCARKLFHVDVTGDALYSKEIT